MSLTKRLNGLSPARDTLAGLPNAEFSRQGSDMTDQSPLYRRLAARAFGWGIQMAAHIVTAVRADWHGCEPIDNQRVYFANHTSNADLPMIWAVLPPQIRRKVRPVAAADYWLKNPLRAFIGKDVLNAVLIDRRPEARAEGENPMQDILDALSEGASLIIFPEGLRNMTEEKLMPLKAGIYNMGAAMPDLELVPVWIENLNKIMPKGEVVPVPLICTVTFGAPMYVGEGEDKDTFLARATQALLETDPDYRRPSRSLPREGATA